MNLRLLVCAVLILLASCSGSNSPINSVSTPKIENTTPLPTPPQSPPTNKSTTPTGWQWVKAGNNVSTSWNVDNGPADVAIDGEKFSARLYWKDMPTEARIFLEGTIQNGKIQVKEEIQASDYTGSVYTGTYLKTDYVETINLSDGFGMIGITQARSR